MTSMPLAQSTTIPMLHRCPSYIPIGLTDPQLMHGKAGHIPNLIHTERLIEFVLLVWANMHQSIVDNPV